MNRSGAPTLGPMLRDFVSVPNSFHRSVHLPYDWKRRDANEDYFVTDAIRETAAEILSELARTNGTRSWTVTGPYGAGKSAFLLFLADLLARDKPEHAVAADLRREQLPNGPLLRPLLLQAESGPLVPAIASALADLKLPGVSVRARRLAKQAAPSGTDCIELLTSAAKKSKAGLLLVIDELGKYLEFAASRRGEDIFLLQQLAEAAERNEPPILLIGVLHSGFGDYLAPVTGSSATRRAEWQKVQGRFRDLPFALPDEQILDLVGKALRWSGKSQWRKAYRAKVEAVIDRLPRGNNPLLPAADLLGRCAPLHPTTALLLWPLFRSKAAQNERSLFTFLTSHEPYGFRQFLKCLLDPDSARNGRTLPFYRLPEFYDYVTAALGSAAFMGTDARRWGLIADSLQRIPANSPPLAADVVKAIGLVTLYGEGAALPADRTTLEAALDHCRGEEVSAALEVLTSVSIVVWRKHRSAFGLWEGSDIDLDAALARALGERSPAPLHERLLRVAVPRPLAARAHSIKTGTLRWFEPRITGPSQADVLSAAEDETEADGILLFVVGNGAEGADGLINATPRTRKALPAGRLFPSKGPAKPVLIAEPRSGVDLIGALDEVEAWQWVQENVPELAGDETARREADAREEAARRRFEQTAGPALGLHGHVLDPAACRWRVNDQLEDVQTPRALQALLSKLCDEAYEKAPPLHNELLNRKLLSSAAAAGRRNLVERLVANPGDERLGITGHPPEYSMYRSLVVAGKFHRRTRRGRLQLCTPTGPEWQPPWKAIRGFVRKATARPLPCSDLAALLAAPPFGVRAGPFPVLLTLFLQEHGDSVALYEDDLFVPDTGIETLERLIRRPETFSIRSYRFEAADRSTLAALAVEFGIGERRPAKALIAATRNLVGSAVNLPAYSRQTRAISETARRVRDLLLTARDPRDLILRDLPEALSVSHSSSPEQFACRLKNAVIEATGAFEALLRGIESAIAESFGFAVGGDVVRERLRALAQRVRATDPQMRLFVDTAARIASGSDDWRQDVARSLADGLPPDQWSDDHASAAHARIRLFGHQTALLDDAKDSMTTSDAANGASTNGSANGRAGDLCDLWLDEARRFSPHDRQTALGLLSSRLSEMASDGKSTSASERAS